jgi:hypothetical protein
MEKRAVVALHKRAAFEHEAEVRLIYTGRADQTPAEALDVEWDANQEIDRIVLDGRLNEAEAQERTTAIRGAGYNGPVERSRVYQRKLVQVFLPSGLLLGSRPYGRFLKDTTNSSSVRTHSPNEYRWLPSDFRPSPSAVGIGLTPCTPRPP